MPLVYENLVRENRPAFISKLKAVASRLGFNPNWIMLVMKLESGFNPKAYNPMGGAAGLIQFMPFVAKSLGTTTQAILKMSNVEQLDYVEKYFRLYAKYVRSFTDLYLINFYPAALIERKPDSWNFPDLIYKYNTSLDIDKDKIINLGEWKKYILTKVPNSFPKDQLGLPPKKK